MKRWLRFGIIGLTLLGGAPGPVSGSDISLERMVGQMVLAGFRGLEVQPDDPIMQDISHGFVGGVILFDRDVLTGSRERNVRDREQLSRLIADLQEHASTVLFIAIDQEGGLVSRLKPVHGFEALASHRELGEGSPSSTFAAASDMAQALAGLGVNLNFAPVVDVNMNPENPVIGSLGRSFSADASAVARHGEQFARAMDAAGVIPAIKHFPGHGSSLADSHLGFTDITQTWNPHELLPFREMIANGFGGMVMTGHLFHRELDAEYPATLSRVVLQDLLRQELGFTGVIVSDDMQMKAITDHFGFEEALERAVYAGVDILLLGNNLEYDPLVARRAVKAIVEMVERGTLPRERIEASYERIQALKRQLEKP
ncbi:glycoside hydrolase family 3 domain protein [Desulfurispirillum indicum S5]|uniref:Glycoside hydrolase family 3 domain protein n=1 Tax=Desulfurispirillum indicum (strain ATCC BAA-1389 / DSM 22839 / S5) TaxID=653733 RepID=E6W270_DESIS|nr:glycoside hydrolase family 3 N-terminal domain-containing protein [Desulfurispirillum indicum]ADU65528.1 glycoside hydrolase family 3 domain protein [Desulfurispirillum indicum S5]